MRKNNFILILLSIFFISACTSEDDSSIVEESTLFLKSRKNIDPNFSYLDEFFVFENGYLTNASGHTTFQGDYQYDSSGKLIKRITNSSTYNYEYDSQDRLIRENKENSNDFVELLYDNNSVTINNFYEFSNSSTTETNLLTLNSNGKIIKKELLTETSSYTFMTQEYNYDSNGNITQLMYKNNNYGDPDRVINYQYDNNPNAYYYALKKLFNSVYFLECRTGIPTYIDGGITPNNMTVSGSETYAYTYNDLNYPTEIIKTYYNGSFYDTSEYVIEYYE